MKNKKVAVARTCTRCNQSLGDRPEYRQGKLIKSHVVCPPGLTAEQIDLGAKWLGLSNLAALEDFNGNSAGQPKTLKGLKETIDRAYRRAVFGGIESGMCEQEAINAVNLEIADFRKNLIEGDQYWPKQLRQEIPVLFRKGVGQ